MRQVFLSFRLHKISRSVWKFRRKQTACQKNALTILQATFLKDAPAIIPPTPEGELTNNPSHVRSPLRRRSRQLRSLLAKFVPMGIKNFQKKLKTLLF